MSNPHNSYPHTIAKRNRRRPTGVSRRQGRLHLGFEPLEDRRVMSANSPQLDLLYDTTSYSSATPEGAQQILLRELERYLQQVSSTQVQVGSNAIPTDPLLSDQWHLINTGQQVGNPDFQDIFAKPGEDINVAPVWQLGYTGDGVVVAVIDSALQVVHPDLAGNVSDTLGYNTFTGDEGPDAVGASDHGTAVAGIIAALANNNMGGTGVAPGVTLVPIEYLNAAGVGNASATALIEAFRYDLDLNDITNNSIDITNNSWGPQGNRSLAGPTLLESLALRDSIFFGRPDENGNALGIIHVFAAGNDGLLIDTSSYNGWINSRYTIGVTGVDHDGEYNNVDGTVTSYPETGASVLVAAPTGSNTLGIVNDTFPGNIGSGITTTDLLGEAGLNGSDNSGLPFGDRDFLEDIDYTSVMNGTSAAAPMVSAVIALMLEANPNLSWRDVQEILVRSARQNAEFATQANGIDKAVGIEYQNTWIINQMPLFHEPDVWDPLIAPALQLFHPTLDPDLTFTFGFNDTHYAPTPQVLTNGAGYTISQGRGTNYENIGYAHGTVDAELAVKLAEQWHLKNQALPKELTFTTAINGSPNLPAAETADDIVGTVDLIIPGGIGGVAGFSDYWAEYVADDPDFGQAFAARGIPIELSVPSPNDMTIENLELTVQIAGDMTEFLDNVRIVVVSPSGTHAELNHYFLDPSLAEPDNAHQVDSPLVNLHELNGFNGVSTNNVDYIDAGSVDNGINTFTFNTNRFWGERSDDVLIFDPTTNEPAGNLPGNLFNLIDPSQGGFTTSGWQIYMENYSPASFVLSSFEVAWHGSPIAANTERVQGLIGVDDNEDDFFNFSRVIQQIQQIDADPTLRFGEIQNLIDPNHESMGENVTVFAYRDLDSDGVLDPTDVLVDQFVTGADGNFYFDLVPNDYIITLDLDSLGARTALDDSLSPSNIIPNYKSEWAITEDWFRIWDYDSNLDVALDPITGAPVSLGGSTVPTGMKNINFLLDPGAPAVPEVVFNGTVYADLNGDGVFNTDDVALPGVSVFGDVNRNGEFDSGEIFVTTDANGNYELTVPITATSVINVGVRPPAGWSTSNPETGSLAFFVEQGDELTDVDFYVMPPLGGTSGDGSALSGIILGTVFNDANRNAIRDPSEIGVPNQTVFLDRNNSGVIDAGDVVTQTNSQGAYVFTGVANGSHFLRIALDAESGISQSFPILNLPQVANITSGGTDTGVDFGVTTGGSNGGGGGPAGLLDYGDLPDVYGTRLEDNGARHPEGIFFLGASIDSENDGAPTSDASGDDTKFVDDEDGIVLLGGSLVPGSTGIVTATASRHSGFLNAWMDFNNDGDFTDIIDGVSEHVIVNRLLDGGANSVSFSIPNTIVGSNVYARFRFGEFGLGSTGRAQIGEVEDYAYPVAGTSPLLIVHGPDFDEDGDVDGADFLRWQRSVGLQSNALPGNGDADSDGAVTGSDLRLWQRDFGGTPQNFGAAVAIETEGDDELAAPLVAASLATSEEDAIAPSLVQPGFREEYVATYVGLSSLGGYSDNATEAAPLEDDQLVSLVSEFQRRNQHRFDAVHAHFEERAEQVIHEVVERLEERISDLPAGHTRRLNALHRVLDRLEQRHADCEEEALAIALEDETDWRTL